jgi:hypothetical protein
MLSALLSFLGGSVFRMLWGEISSFFKAKQEHAQEMERMRLQMELEDKRAEQDRERIKLQHDLGVKEVQIAGDVEIAKSEASAFMAAMKDANKKTGIAIVDIWNGIIRPSYATLALALWAFKVYTQGFKMDDFDIGMLAVIAGFYFADRSLSKRGK